MKKFSIAIALLLCLSLLAACGEDVPGGSSVPSTAPVSGERSYSVTILDPVGNPVTEGVVVNFMQGEDIAAMQMPNSQGVAEKVLPAGTYTVQLGFTDASAQYYYDTENLTLSPEKSSLQLVLANAPVVDEKTYTNYDPETGEETTYTELLYHAGTGYTHIPLTPDTRNYVYFTPAQPGLYQFSVLDSGATIGYYGSPFYILGESAAELDENGAFTINVSNGMVGTGNTGTAILVLGIDGGALESCVISIQRLGDPELTIEDIPWDIYQAKAVIQAFTLPADAKLSEFDLTASSYSLVLNETDGFYHLNTADGPIVYAKLGVASDYMDSIKAVIDNSAVSRYYYDENGDFVKKVNFTNCLVEYVAAMDSASGLYPLTEDLAYIFKERGEYVGWWDSSSHGYLFKDSNGNPVPGINPDVAWLFLCCYDAQGGQQGGSAENNIGTPANAGSPIVLGGTEALDFTAEVEAGQYVYYELYKISGADLVINDVNAYVIMNGEVYWPQNGLISIPMVSEGPSVPISLAIGNAGGSKASFSVTCVYPIGSMANPGTLVIGSFTTELAEGNDAGYFYNYTAETDGTLTIHIDSVTEGVQCGVVLYNHNSYAYRSLDADGADNTLSIEVSAGDVVQITIAALPDSTYKYPAATVKATASVQ